MIISEVSAVLDLVVKATSFTSQLQDGWYKRSAELDAFEDKVWVLSAKHAQWSEQMQRYGISEDEHLLRLVKAAEEALKKQQQSVRKLQKSPFRRWKKRVFPSQLSYFLGKVLEIVDAGPQLLAIRVANNDLLERYMAQTPAPLPFGPDRNYVPIEASVLEVRNTLENAEGPRVVTVYGGPGMGKSSLVKYLAIHYQEDRKRLRMDASFPHGVHYLFCGQHAGEKVKQLQLELLESLGFGTGSAFPNDPGTYSTTAGDYIALPSYQMRLRSRLAEQKLLIIVDDLWEATVLQELLVPAKGIKYLVTSQMRDIYIPAEKIQMKNPTERECRQIMANYTDKLPKRGEFPPSIKSVTDDIIRKLDYHPLSLANIGISINRSRATDISLWDVIRKDLYIHLDENDFNSPPAFGKPYNLPVSASMMLMVDSLPPEAQRLLFLIALLKGQNLPVPLVKYFYRFIQTNNVLTKYNNHERFLEDRSLIQLTRRGDRSTLCTHGLRTHYIRQTKDVEVRSIAFQILVASGDQDHVAQLVKRGDAEHTLVTVLSAMYYHDRSLIELVASTLENHINVINDGVIPRSLSVGTNTLDLVEGVRRQTYEIEGLVWLLNADHEGEHWKQQAHECVKKIIIKFICQGKLEDHSMAYLLQIPQTTSIACATLRVMCMLPGEDFFERNITFSEAYGETMQTLLALFDNNDISFGQRIAVTMGLLDVLDHETKDTILNFAAKYEKLVAKKSNANLNDGFTLHALANITLSRDFCGRGIRTMAEPSGLLESLMAILVSGSDDALRRSAGMITSFFCQSRHLALKIRDCPDALKTLLDLFLSKDMLSSEEDRIHEDTGNALYDLSIFPENRIKLGSIDGIWEGLGGILTKLEEAWRATHHDWHGRFMLEKRARLAAGILGHLGLEKGLRETVASLSTGVGEGLLFLQHLDMVDIVHRYGSRFSIHPSCYNSTLALTVLDCADSADPRSIDISSTLKDMLQIFPADEGRPPSEAIMDSFLVHICYICLHWSRVLAYIQMGSYAEGLQSLDLVHHHLDLVQNVEISDPSCRISKVIRVDHSGVSLVEEVDYPLYRISTVYHPCDHTGGWGEIKLGDCMIFLQAMVGDYARALQCANRRLEEDKKISSLAVVALAERGVLKRLCGDLQGALADLNAATMKATMGPVTPIRKDEVLWNRGYVKYLMGDEKGAKNDAESALQLQRSSDFTEVQHLWLLTKIPVSYLGFSLD